MTIAAMVSTVANPVFREAVTNEVDVIARLRPGVTIAQAAMALRNVGPRLSVAAPAGAPRDLVPVVRSFENVMIGDVQAAMLVLFAAVTGVLLIAIANVANLLLMRGEGRRSELALRAALGASSVRLAGQLLAESVVLALAAGASGLALSWATLRAVITLLPVGMPRIDSVRIDARVVLFSVIIALVVAALAGIVPALSAAHLDPMAALRFSGHGASGQRARYGRRVLVVAQVALAVTILVATGLLTRTLLRLQSVDIGMAADRLVFVRVAMPRGKYTEQTRHVQFLNEAVAQLEALPVIDGATPVNLAPFTGLGWDAPTFTVDGQSAEQSEANVSLNLEAIHPNYFNTTGVTIIRGRGFTEQDRQGAPNVAIVSEDVAARMWPGENPVGKRLKMGRLDSQDPWRTVVGVARATRYRELQVQRPTLYLPAEQFIVTAEAFLLRTTSPRGQLAGLVRSRMGLIDPDVRIMDVAPFSALSNVPLAKPRFNAVLTGVFAGAALLMAAIGLYAVIAAQVRQRFTEIGIRVALGATSSDVRRLVLGEGLRLAAVGAAIGIVMAALAMRLLRSLLFNVAPLDLPSIAGAALLLVAVSTVACYLPARRATHIDPICLLRSN